MDETAATPKEAQRQAAENDADASTDRKAAWIWIEPNGSVPKNRYTYFRQVVHLDEVPANGGMSFAADSTAQLFINGHLLLRKVSRFDARYPTAETVEAGPYLRRGANVIVVLHHNWGPIVTFQRSGNETGRLYISSNWVVSGRGWKWTIAPQFAVHDGQILGRTGDPRLRFPVVFDATLEPPAELYQANYDDSAWSAAGVLHNQPVLAPEPVETAGQRETFQAPLSIVASGTLQRAGPIDCPPIDIAKHFDNAEPRPEQEAAYAAGVLTEGGPRGTFLVAGRAGESRYITLDFARPVHGFPLIELSDATAEVRCDFGYGEIFRSQYDGSTHVNTDGRVRTEGVVGAGYADRVITRAGPQTVELPDERTARWLGLHVHFQSDGFINLRRLGFIKSQYALSPGGSFHCGNERVEQIVKLALIHAEVTMTDCYVDTPGREDGQWIEDARPRALVAQSWFGDWKLRRLMIRTHAQSQRDDGSFHPFAPSNYPAWPSPYDWSMQWVAALYDDWQWTGDLDYVRRFWPNVVKFWNRLLSHVDERGLWVTNALLQDIRVTQRLEPGESSGMITPAIIARLRWSQKMAEALGETKQAIQWNELAARMERAFRALHVVRGTDQVPAHVADRTRTDADSGTEASDDGGNNARGLSQAGQLWGVLYGLLPLDEATEVVDYAFPDPDGSPPMGVARWNNPTWAYRALRALTLVGRSRRAVAHLLERYAPYLPGHTRNPTPLALQGPYGGPLPEYWISREDQNLSAGQINTAQPIDNTGSHGWGAVPLLWMHDSLLGVRILEPGGRRIAIAPDDAGLAFVAGHVMTPRGAVWVHFDPQQLMLEVNLPADVTAVVTLPPAMGRAATSASCNVTFTGNGTYLVTGRCTWREGPADDRIESI